MSRDAGICGNQDMEHAETGNGDDTCPFFHNYNFVYYASQFVKTGISPPMKEKYDGSL